MNNGTCPQLSLDLLGYKAQFGSITSNPDIAGLGVLISFVASAYLTLALVIVYYGCGCNEEASSNPIDRAIVQRTKKWPLLRAIYYSEIDWKALLDKTILNLSDQQLVTGLAILISAYSQLPFSSGDVSSYHWQLMVYTAWFASLTHLTTLTIMRTYFREVKEARFWRLCLMSLLMSMLIVALLPTGNILWLAYGNRPATAAVPARCFFRLIGRKDLYLDAPYGGNFLSMLFSLLVISVSHATRAIRVSRRASAQSQSWLRDKPLAYLESVVQRCFEQVNKRAFKTFLSSVVFASLLAIVDVFASLAWEIIWLLYTLIWGTSHLAYARQGYPNGEVEKISANSISPDGDNLFSFGQCAALILLTLPGLSMIQNYFELKRQVASSRKSTNTSEITRPSPLTDYRNVGATSNVGRMIRMGARFTHDDALSSLVPLSYVPSITQPVPSLEDMEQDSVDRASPDLIVRDEHRANSTTGFSCALSQYQSYNSSQTPPQTNFVSSKLLYRFEWFRLLVLMIFLLVSAQIMEIIIIVIYGSRITTLSSIEVLEGVGSIACAIILWTGTCVLSIFFQPKISSLVDHVLGPNQVYRSVGFRLLWYLWYIFLLVGVLLEIYLRVILEIVRLYTYY